jgi:hypothetical protein
MKNMAKNKPDHVLRHALDAVIAIENKHENV